MKQNRKILTLPLEKTAIIIPHNDAKVVVSHTLMFFMHNCYSLKLVVIIESMTPQDPLGHCPGDLLARTPPQWQRLTG